MAVLNMVLIHGWTSDESIWQETQNYLDQRYRVYTLNLPIAKDIDSYRDAVIGLIEKNGLHCTGNDRCSSRKVSGFLKYQLFCGRRRKPDGE